MSGQPNWVRRFFKGMLDAHTHEEPLLGEEAIRARFEIPLTEKCCDGAQHLEHCNYVLAESKHESNVPDGVEQLESTADYIVKQNHGVEECVIICKSLGKYKRVMQVKNGYLWNKTKKDYYAVNDEHKIKVIYHSELVKV